MTFNIRLRTQNGWVYVSEKCAARWLTCTIHEVGRAAIEHNEYMTRRYPLGGITK